ncbi:MAG TPA: TVP38/TMEM64 family protein [Phenylobacterium sp.]|nr:TVP38/TMEM64 family protein [Phenylobacterium sp.]
MRRVFAFLSNMDAKAWRALAISFVLFGGVGVVFLFGAQVLGFGGQATVEHWLGAASGPWALPVAVAGFAALAFLGVPQFMLIAAAVVAFGAWAGFAYSWIGTMVSSMVGFYLGRLAGARTLKTFSGEGLRQFMDLVGRNGFFASLIVRLVPSAPFIVVNMAAGVTPMRVVDFAFGTAIGIVPKIALTCFAGNSLARLLKGQGGANHIAAIVGVVVVWLVIGWYARRWLKAREATAATSEREGAP